VSKGSFTQGVAVLLERAVDVPDLREYLRAFEIARTIERSGDSWMGAPGLTIAMRPEVNGYVVVDVIDRPWPDAMGDPKQDSMLFGAWAMGWFGPFVYPGSLERAQQMSFAWADATAVSTRHQAFIRIKSSYVLGADQKARITPEDYAPIPELEFVTSVARALLEHPAALAYFNPNGEVLRSPEGCAEDVVWHRDHDVMPLPLWSNVRLFSLAPGWTLMDTIGMEQLGVDDQEACFSSDRYAPPDVARFLRNATSYVCTQGPVIRDGDTIDGPGGLRWSARTIEQSRAPRPRRVLRWIPMDGASVPDVLGS